MTNTSLAASYLEKASKRLKILDVLHADAAYSDVVREAQEVVELALKGMLRQVGIEPPNWHDVGSILAEHATRFTDSVRVHIDRLREISTRLRKDRERTAVFRGERVQRDPLCRGGEQHISRFLVAAGLRSDCQHLDHQGPDADATTVASVGRGE